MSELLAACAELKQDDPTTGRTVILSTYNTFIRHGLTINKDRREARHNEQKILMSYRPNDFASEDFNLVWDIPVERVVADEGHRAKHPKTRINAALRTLTCSNFWLVSATPIYNTIEDIVGITKLMEKHLIAADLGIHDRIDEPDGAEPATKTLSEINKLSPEEILGMYKDANSAWNRNVDSWITARTFQKGRVPENIKPWYNSQGKTTAELYGLHLLEHDMVVAALEKNLHGGRIIPRVAKEVVSLILRISMIRRTKASVESIIDQKGKAKPIVPGDGMKPCIVSTVDLTPGYAEYIFYQKNLAPLHQDRINETISKRLLRGQTDRALDSTFERLSIAGTAHPIIARDIIELINLQRKAREAAKEERKRLKVQGSEGTLQAPKKKRKKNSVARPLNEEELKSCELNKDTLVWKNHLPLGKARTFNDRYATHWFLKTPNGDESNVPSSRMELLKHLLVDSTKYRYMARALINAKTTKKRVIIFVTYPVQQIFLETISCLLDIPVISMRCADDASARRSKIKLFNDPTANAYAFLSTNLIAGQSLNLHQCCNHMIQCDIANSLNTMLQMKGRIDCVGQTQETLVEILALDYTADVHRQGCVAGKIVPVLSAMMEHGDTDTLPDRKKDQIIRSVGEEYTRTFLGQSCSRAGWRTIGSKYQWAFSDDQEDPQVTRDHKSFDKLLEKYRRDSQASDQLGEVDNKVFTIELTTNDVLFGNERKVAPLGDLTRKNNTIRGSRNSTGSDSDDEEMEIGDGRMSTQNLSTRNRAKRSRAWSLHVSDDDCPTFTKKNRTEHDSPASDSE